MNEAVAVENLVKIYPRVRAVDGISFTIPKGEIFGLLGPNGAGKTTTIRILLTLIKPTAGKIRVFGLDALTDPDRVRQMAGYVPQDVSVDGEITAYENILIYSKLYGMPRNERKQRIKEVLEYMDLQERANSLVNTFSGGMMRRLEVAQALVNRPRVLFLDEPSIGLDPNARNAIWELINKLRDELGTTILLTTHDMVEADALCGRIGIMDRGKLAVIGPPSQLKSAVGGDVLSISSKAANLSATVKELGYSTIAESSNGTVELLVANGEAAIPQLVEALRTKGVEVDSVSLKKPTLDDVFMKYTGARISEGEGWAQARMTRRTFRRLRT
ncbi:MAG: ATP-binding cassette domain-containing protein [Dehalococcoidia bacterium]